MAITITKINKTLREVNRFISAAKEAKKRLEDDKYAHFGCKETGAVRRASMDLTRILVELRRTD